MFNMEEQLKDAWVAGPGEYDGEVCDKPHFVVKTVQGKNWYDIPVLTGFHFDDKETLDLVIPFYLEVVQKNPEKFRQGLYGELIEGVKKYSEKEA